MIIGVPRERKTLERRIALTPAGAAELVTHGHKVLIETKAGEGAHFSDEDFTKVGAQIVPTLKDVWTKAEMVVKVKEPHESEYEFFRPGLVLFDYLHLASMADVTQQLLRGKVTGIAYELVTTEDRRLPLLEPMSEVAGKLSVQLGAHHLLAQNGGRGVLLGGTIGVPPRRVVIIGAGISGRAAAEIAIGMGATTVVLDIDYKKLDRMKMQFGAAVRTVFSTKTMIETECQKADLVIGAVLIPGAAAPKLITRETIRGMKKGSVFVDISIDQGGCAETSRTTSLEKPTYVEDGVIHYCVPNMPAQTARTSTMALTAATLPYVIKLADLGGRGALEKVPELRNALNTHAGHLTNKAVADSLNMKFTAIEDALRS